MKIIPFAHRPSPPWTSSPCSSRCLRYAAVPALSLLMVCPITVASWLAVGGRDETN